jgi:ribosomal protein L35
MARRRPWQRGRNRLPGSRRVHQPARQTAKRGYDRRLPVVKEGPMPKMKTHKGAAARFKLTKRGKLVRLQSKLNHNFEKKSSATKRRLGRNDLVSEGDRRGVRRMLGI